MKPVARMALLALLAAMAPTVGAQPAPVTDIDAAYATFDAVVTREQRAIAARDRAFAAVREKQRAAVAEAEAELRSRQSQSAELQRIEAQIGATLDRLEQLGTRPQQLLLEKAVLEDWYETLQPAFAHLTESSFRGAELELAALASSGAVEPGPRKFRSHYDVRDRIAHLIQLIGRDQAAREAEAARLLAQVEALKLRWKKAVGELGRPGPSSIAAARLWAEAMLELERQASELNVARSGYDAATRGVLEAAARLRPPILSDVDARVAGRSIYSANWRRDDGGSASESERETRKKQWLAEKREIELVLADLTKLQQEHAAVRGEAAGSLHRVGQMVSRSADRYGDKRMFGAWVTIGVDVGVTAVEVLVTGGAATFARKASEIAEKAALRRATQAATRDITDRGLQVGTDLIAETVRGSAARAARELEAQSAERLRELVAKGMPIDVAKSRVAREMSLVIRQLQDSRRAGRVAEQVAKESKLAVQEATRNEQVFALGGFEVLIPSVLGSRASSAVSPDSQSILAPVNSWDATFVGEAVDHAISQTINTGLAPASAEAVSRAQKLASKARNGFTGNLPALISGVVGSAIKLGVASMLDDNINAEVVHYATLDAELTSMYGVYQLMLKADAEFDAAVSHLRGVDAGLAAKLLMLDAGLRLHARPESVQVDRNDDLALELGFSQPMLGAPVVSLAGVPVPMQRADNSGTRWRGSVPVARLGENGTKPLSVSVGPAQTSYGSLDRDPRTAAVRATRRTQWHRFETGADTNHQLQLELRREAPTAPLATAPEEDPFEAGRALVEEGRALVDGGGTPVASGSSQRVTPPPAPSDEGCNPRTGSFRRLAGTAEILAGGFGYRDTHPDTFDIRLDLSDMASGDVTVCVTLGQGASSGSFVLSDAAARDRILASVGDMRPGSQGSMRFHFDAPLRIAFRGQGNWFSERGARNTISYVVVVRGPNAATARTWARAQGEATLGGNSTSATPPAAATATDVPSGTCRGFNGRWNTNYGVVALRVSGSQVEGSYDFLGNGGIRGTVAGNVLTARWQDNSGGAGSLRFQLATDGRSFSGRWTRDSGSGNDKGEWSGTCQTQ